MTKRILAYILLFTGVFIAGLLTFFIYFGGFKDVTPHREVQGGEIFVYSEFEGDYSSAIRAMDSVRFAISVAGKIRPEKGVMFFYDHPQRSGKDILRSEVGCAIEESDTTALHLLHDNFKIKTLPRKEYLAANFKYKGNMLSIIMGRLKVYTALDSFKKKNGLQAGSNVIELYDKKNKNIIYRAEIH